MRLPIHWLAMAGIVVIGMSPMTRLPAQTESEEQLAAIRAEIARLERQLERQVSRRDDGMSELMAVEVSLAESRAALAELAEQIAAQSERRDRAEADLDEATRNLSSEQTALAEQVRMSYMTGRQELLKLLLSQDRPADLARMLVYYDYLNRHRSARIATVDAERLRLADLARESREAALELERLRAAAEAENASLESERAERARLITELDAAIESSGNEIERMRAEEAELNEVIARLARALEGFPVTSDAPFSDQRGELRWPIDGRLAAEFGDSRDSAGRVRMTGVLIEAEAGTIVRSVYHGQVIHSQWTPGMGLLIIVNHGENYWSLYGHNSALLKEAGDWVEPGEAIAEVGDTGGRIGTALFFGIRHEGEPVDPAGWIR